MTPVYAAIDVDGVVLDLVGYITERLGLDRSKWLTWEFSNSYNDPNHLSEFERLIKHSPDMFVNAQPYPDAQAAISKLLSHGIPFLFMSSFPTEFRLLRQWWLWYNLMRTECSNWPTHVRLIAGHAEAKPELCQVHSVTHILEDKGETAVECRRLGIKAYLVPRVYNQNEPLVPRVTIGQFADLLIREHREPIF